MSDRIVGTPNRATRELRAREREKQKIRNKRETFLARETREEVKLDQDKDVFNVNGRPHVYVGGEQLPLQRDANGTYVVQGNRRVRVTLYRVGRADG